MAQAGWQRVSSEAIKLEGSIDKQSYDEYLRVARDGYSKIILTSPGGVPLVALKIAEDVVSRDVTVVVDGYCMSACANYLAFSGDHLVVNCDSFLAWHGTLETPSEALVRMQALRLPAGLIAAYTEWLTSFKLREKKFFNNVGVDYRLLEDSTQIVRAEKIAPEVGFELDRVTGDYSITRSAALWIPTPDVLENYGVDTSAFCKRYTHSDIEAMLKERGITIPFTSKGESSTRMCESAL